MGDDDDGQAQGVTDVLDEVEDGAGGLRVQGGGGLVAQEDGRVVGQRPGDADALLLAAGELGGVGAAAVGQAHEVEHALDDRVAPPAGHARERQRVGDVLRRGALVQEVCVLEDHADAASGLTQLAGRQGGHVLAGDAHVSAGGALQGGQAAHERGLAGPGGADDAVDGAGGDVEAEPVQGAHLLAAAQAVDLVDVAQGDHGLAWRAGHVTVFGPAGLGGRLFTGCHVFLHRSWRKHPHHEGGCCNVVEPGLSVALDGHQ